MPIDYYTGSPRRRRREGPIGLEHRRPIQPRKAPHPGVEHGRSCWRLFAGQGGRTPLARRSALGEKVSAAKGGGGVPMVFWAEMGVGTLLNYGYHTCTTAVDSNVRVATANPPEQPGSHRWSLMVT